MGLLKSMFERLAGTPCAGCRHMSWDLLADEPWGICTVQVRNKYGKWKPAAAKCEKLGFEYYEREDWKAEKAEAWEREEKRASRPHESAPFGVEPPYSIVR